MKHNSICSFSVRYCKKRHCWKEIVVPFKTLKSEYETRTRLESEYDVTVILPQLLLNADELKYWREVTQD